jgi:hypothetical protein
MSAEIACVYEEQVLDLAAAGRWPDGADDLLRAHAAGCPVCGDLALVAAALARTDAAEARVRVPDAAVVWYGARLLARTEMAARAARPVQAVLILALASLSAILLAGIRAAGPRAAAWWHDSVPAAWPTWAGTRGWLDAASAAEWWIAGAAGACALMVPLALYLVRLADADETPRPMPRP